MNFICLDFEDDRSLLLEKRQYENDSIDIKGQTYYKHSKIVSSKKGQCVFYGKTDLKDYQNIYNYDLTLRTIAAFETVYGIDVINNLPSAFTSKSFTWLFHRFNELNTAFWFTIMSDSGLYFVIPNRQSTSKEITNYKVVQERRNYNTNFKYEGETGADFNIDVNSSSICSATIDSNLKTTALNKYKSMQDMITVASGQEASPLDYIQYNNKVYIIVSKKTDKNTDTKLYYYTAVKEENSSYTFAGSDISTVIPLFKQGEKLLIDHIGEYITGHGIILDNSITGTSAMFTGLLTAGANIKLTNKIYPAADGTTAIQFTKANGSTLILNIDTSGNILYYGTTYKLATGGETAPDVDNGGICINQNAGTGRIISLKSTGVSNHPFTSYSEADTYLGVNKYSATLGGAAFTGYSSGDTGALGLGGYVGSASPTITVPCLDLFGYKSDGSTGRANLAATELLARFRNGSATIISIYGDGSEKLVDNAKLLIGTGSDLQLYHDTINSYIYNDTGILKIQDAGSGIQIGTATTQLLGFYGVACVDQPAAVADATGAGDVVTQLNLLLARIRELGLIAI